MCIHIRRSEHGYKVFADIIRIYITALKKTQLLNMKNTASKQDLNITNS